MEVHHTTHPEALPAAQAGKRLKHYLFEFFMLFLAVFCGFLAENFRERQLEHQQEKQFMQSMIKDLQKDLTNISITTSVKKEEIEIADSLYQSLNSPDYKKKLSLIYYYGRLFSATYNIFTMTDGTLSQLKNAGGFRLINKQNIVDSILSYNYLYQQFKVDQDILYLSQLQDYRAVMIQVFDIHVFDAMISDESGDISIPTGNPALFNPDSKLINELLMRVHLAKRNILTMTKSDLPELEAKARKLIGLIKKEYHLK
ncbi:MAG TPA: hypothetical protein VHD35_08105 [Chitinophagaceae bacterium]|nr:hypothetical protein [Chitinophagaceae bacterium]